MIAGEELWLYYYKLFVMTWAKYLPMVLVLLGRKVLLADLVENDEIIWANFQHLKRRRTFLIIMKAKKFTSDSGEHALLPL